MAKRINVALPDDLHERLQKVKAKINVSRICQEAIMTAVQTVEVTQDGDVVDFLKAGKEDYFAPYIKRGIGLANEALKQKDLPYSTLVMLEEAFGGENEDTYDIDDAYVNLAGALMDDPDLFENYIKDEFTPGEDPAILNYLAAGFIIGVLKIWEELEI